MVQYGFRVRHIFFIDMQNYKTNRKLQPFYVTNISIDMQLKEYENKNITHSIKEKLSKT